MTRSTTLLSFWRNDAARALEARASALLRKADVAVWLWVVGDSPDATGARLTALARGRPVTVLRHDTGCLGEDPASRLRRLSETANAALDAIGPAVDRIVIHESDLESPDDVVAQLAGADDEAVAGWPTLTLDGQILFYDTWAYRAGGRHFGHWPPYHPAYRAGARFAVDSVGSCWSIPAWAIRAGARCEAGLACVGLCAALRARGVRILVDPRVPVIQPAGLWTCRPWTPAPDMVPA